MTPKNEIEKNICGMKYLPPKQTCMQILADKYDTHKHLGAYTLLNATFFKYKIGLKIYFFNL